MNGIEYLLLVIVVFGGAAILADLYRQSRQPPESHIDLDGRYRRRYQHTETPED